ncbi:MAG: flavin reductase, partial [Gemmatimonadetes bacterium]|nr:flavin reductase [Gemmatimonadota bacterium]
MDTLEKNRAIQMLQSGVYVLTAQAEEDKAVATVVSWVTQASFSPPLVVVALRVGSRIHGIVQ